MTRREIIQNLKGIFVPVATPFNRRGHVDEIGFRANLRRLTEVGLSGIVVAGSTGEAPYLSEGERLRLAELARDVVPPPELLIVGTGLEGTHETLRLSREAIARGADAVLAITPNYFKSRMDSAALIRHFRALADGLRRAVVIYSIPQFTGIRIKPDALAELSHHPNIAGVKESSGDLAYVRAILREVRPGFRVLIGAALILLDGLRAGAAGGVLGQANFAPELCVGVYEAFRNGNSKTARELHQRLLPLVQKITAPHGVPGVKAAMDLCGYAGGAPRSPLIALGSTARRAVGAVLEELRTGLEI